MLPLNLPVVFSLLSIVHTQLSSSSIKDSTTSSDPYTATSCCQFSIAKHECVQREELPVNFKSFTVKRLSTKVDLVWETTWECNSRGFEIQRKVSDGEWQKVAFVFSQAPAGNSIVLLTYEYTDVNTGRSESQYRLRQIDNDLQTAFSEVRRIGGY